MENINENNVCVNNSSTNTEKLMAIDNLLICIDKDRLLTTMNDLMMSNFTSEIEQKKVEDLIILMLFLEGL
jgi:hypothetical protein